MKNKSTLSKLVLATGVLASTAGMASAQLTTSIAEAAIGDAVIKGTAVIGVGFAIGALFLVARVIRRGMSSAK